MDSALKRDAIVPEVTLGTTPATPGFLNLRTISIDGDPERPNERSPERVYHGQATNMYQGLARFPKTFNLPFARDAATDLLWSSLFNAAWATNVLKNGQTPVGFTLEEKYEGGATDPYRRISGMLVDSATIAFAMDGQPGRLNFIARGRDETTATAAISGATYADPTPGYDPVTMAEVAVGNLFSVTSPIVQSLNLQISNSLQERYGAGSAKPVRHGRGWFDVRGTAEFDLSAAADYSTFATRQQGLAFDITIGSVTNYKDKLEVMKADVWNPNLRDPGVTGTHTVMLNFMARYNAADTAAIKLTRLVA